MTPSGQPERRRGLQTDSEAVGTLAHGGKTVVRHEKILQWLAEHGEASGHELAERFGVSVITIRRDLMLLERQGKLRRTHGGAILSQTRIVEFSFLERGRVHAAEKEAIARQAVRLVQPGMSVSLDSGTTTFEVAMALRHIDPLTVLTSSLAIASVLYAHRNLELVLVGGTARTGSPDLTGMLTEENLRQFHVDLAFVGADGVSRDGAYTAAVGLTRVCRAIMDGAERTVLIVDHSKFEKPSFSRFASLKQFDRVITDAGAPAAVRQWLAKAAHGVTYAEI